MLTYANTQKTGDVLSYITYRGDECQKAYDPQVATISSRMLWCTNVEAPELKGRTDL